MKRRPQRSASKQPFLLPLEGQAAQQRVADVALQVRSHVTYTYAIPDALAATIAPGVAVRAPFGRSGRVVDGTCTRVTEQPWDHTLRPIREVTDGARLLTPPLIALGLWIAGYYGYPPGATLAGLIAAPPPAKRKRKPPIEKSGAAATVMTATDENPDEYVLTADQQAAIAAIAAAAADPPLRPPVFVLFGVPGSGKTEVYVRSIRQVIAAGRQAILLVPEIALATQIVDRLLRRFERVAVLHSRMTPRQRGDALSQIAAGAADVVIGTRSAVFAPTPRLGLIVVDEEQESSFKNLASPYYHARDVAIKRGQIERVPVVLGSATPSLETWHNAHSLPHFRLQRLTQRVPGAELPRTQLIPTAGRDMAGALLSVALVDALRATLAAGDQAILLHNRRGYAAVLRCAACGQRVPCPGCGGRLVLHRAGVEGAAASLRCHRCGLRAANRERCVDSSCNGRLEQVGLAIQRLEEELARALPAARLLRLDRDTMRRRGDYAAALARFAAREADILLGTQMVAKGLDFPGVRLVGVIDADAALWLPDFRASERVFHLLMQVVGRAGRRAGQSLALIQSTEVAAPAIRHALRMDYEAFAEEELSVRHQAFLPPFVRLMRLVLADPQPAQARHEAVATADALSAIAARVHARIQVLDAEPCPIARLRGLARYQVCIHLPRDADGPRLLLEAVSAKALAPRVKRFTIDVDPVEML